VTNPLQKQEFYEFDPFRVDVGERVLTKGPGRPRGIRLDDDREFPVVADTNLGQREGNQANPAPT